MVTTAAIFGDSIASNLIPFTNIYLKAFISFLAVTLFLYVIIFIIDKVLKRFLRRTKTTLDDEIFAAAERPIYVTAFLFGVGIGLTLLGLDPDFLSIIQKILITLITITLFFPAYRITNILMNLWFGKYARKVKISIDPKLLPVLNRLVKIIYFVIFVILILKLYNLDVGPLLASLGIAGLAVGLALKDILNNIFSGAFIIADKSLKIGDRIQLESGEVGIVKDIGLRTTRIETFDKITILVPNSQLANNRVLNYSLPNLHSRIKLDVGVAYGTNIDKLKKILLDCVKVVDKNIIDNSNEPVVYFTDMGDFALTFRIVVHITDVGSKYKNEAALREAVYKRLNKEKIDIPFPTRTIYVKK